jgi:hypothetical protein
MVKVYTGEVSELIEPTQVEKTMLKLEDEDRIMKDVKKKERWLRHLKLNETYTYDHYFTDYSTKVNGIHKVGKISSDDAVMLRR